MKPKIFYWLSFFGILLMLLDAVGLRLYHAYLEDDMLWMLPLITQLMEQHTLGAFLAELFKGELTFFDGTAFAFLYTVFRENFLAYSFVLLSFHLLNSFLFFILLRRYMRLSLETSFLACLIYLSFYAQCHALTFLISLHHMTIVFTFFLVLCFYFKINEKISLNQDVPRSAYAVMAILCVFLAPQRLAVLILPVMMGVHMLYTSRTKEDVIQKYTFWMPLFMTFIGYQIFIIFIGNQGDVLDRFLEPFYKTFELDPRVWSSLISAVAITAGSVFGAREVLRFVWDKAIFKWVKGVGKKVLYGVLVFPQWLGLCLALFVLPLVSAHQGDVLMRWQQMGSPVEGRLWMLVILIAAVLWFFFLRLMRRDHKSLVIFIVWYMAVIFYFWGSQEDIPSRYFIYLSPVFAVVVSCFFMEVLGRRLSSRRYMYFICALFIFFCFLNTRAIKWRLSQTLLTDYIWSYDYIKIAHAIQQDLAQKYHGGKMKDLDAVCIEGIEGIPYAKGWKEDFLGRNFDDLRPFIMTLRSVLKDPDVLVQLNEDCSGVKDGYQVTDRTVVNAQGEDVEPFYIFFRTGMTFIKKGDFSQAYQQLQKAVSRPPFLVQFFMGQKIDISDPAILSKMSSVANVIRRVYGSRYQDEPKLQKIEVMIQQEALDYGAAWMWLTYLASRRSEERYHLFGKVAAQWITSREMMGHDFLSESMTQIQREHLTHFVRDILPDRIMVHEGDPVGEYKNYNIYFSKLNRFYVGLSNKDLFDLCWLKQNNFQDALIASSMYALRRQIDHMTGKGNIFTEEREYRQFKMMFHGDRWDNYFMPQGQDRYRFSAQSFFESKLVIDHFLSL